MKKIFRKKQLIITSLAFLLAVAGYISYDRVNSTEEETASTGAEAVEESYVIDNTTYDIYEEEEEETLLEETAAVDSDAATDSDEIINAGETVLTSVSVTGADYAAEVKLNREQVRSKNRESLQAIIDNETLTEAQKQDAIDAMVALADISEKESNAEMLLEAKGFTNVVVSISDDSCDVVVDMGDVTDAKRAQVEDIVKRKTGISAENIIITTIAAE